MRSRWLRFFLLLFPAALLGFEVLCEGVAYELRGVQPFRTSLDAIVVAAEKDPVNAKWLVFGDSTTQHVLMDYTIGPRDVVANLTTHAGAGMPSMYLLLRRYLATHAPPKGIILALIPEMFLNHPDEKDADFWLVPVFLKPEEQKWLSQFYTAARPRGWRPAAADLKRSILDPATGLFAPSRNHLPAGNLKPSPDIPKEAPQPPTALAMQAEAARASEHVFLGSMPRQILTQICGLARQDRFRVQVVMAPVPQPVLAAWQKRGELTDLQNAVDDVVADHCAGLGRVDWSDAVDPPNFDDEGTHIRGLGWENQWALALQRYISDCGDAADCGENSTGHAKRACVTRESPRGEHDVRFWKTTACDANATPIRQVEQP